MKLLDAIWNHCLLQRSSRPGGGKGWGVRLAHNIAQYTSHAQKLATEAIKNARAKHPAALELSGK
jgi:hypothetical protein